MGDLVAVARAINEAQAQSGLRKRQAARRACISDSRWRQITDERGPVSTKDSTLAKMAWAVDANPNEILALAGMSVPPEMLSVIREEWMAERAAKADEERRSKARTPGKASTPLSQTREVSFTISALVPVELGESQWRELRASVEAAAMRSVSDWLARNASFHDPQA